jgi:peptidoglycan/LPS O-acetylase OafA/YrhL
MTEHARPALPDGQPASGGTPLPDRPFFGRVEAFRGLGALAVAAYHFAGGSVHGQTFLPLIPWAEVRSGQDLLQWLANVMIPGHPALLIFFVISGFVLRLALEYGPQQAGPATGQFLIARIFRVYPIVFFAVFLQALLACFLPYLIPEHSRPRSGWNLLANLLLLDASMNSGLWALQLEVCMVPIILILYFLERRNSPWVLLWIALLCTPGVYVGSSFLWAPLAVNCFAFVLGMLVPTLGRRFATRLTPRASRFWLLGCLLVLALVGPCVGRYSRWATLVEGYAGAVFVSLAAYRTDLSLLRWLDARSLRLLGRSSGSYYVLHMHFPPLGTILLAAVIPFWSTSIPLLVGLLGISLWLLAMVPVALLTYALIEAPGIALGRKVIRACGLAPARPPAPDPAELVRREAA